MHTDNPKSAMRRTHQCQWMQCNVVIHCYGEPTGLMIPHRRLGMGAKRTSSREVRQRYCRDYVHFYTWQQRQHEFT